MSHHAQALRLHAASAVSPTLTAVEELLEARRMFGHARMLLGCARVQLGRTITDRRMALDLSGEQLARIAGVNASELSKLERGKLALGVAIARKVDAALTAIEIDRAALRRTA